MKEIKPSIEDKENMCTETAAGPGAFVVFGASGDLAHRKLLVGMFRLFSENLLSDRFYLLGCGRKNFSDEDFRIKTEKSIRNSSDFLSSKRLDDFTSRIYYTKGDYNDAGLYERIASRVAELNQKHNVPDNLVLYLAVPPFLYTTIVEHLGCSGLAGTKTPGEDESVKLVVEKPFGRDLHSAVDLNNCINRYFKESCHLRTCLEQKLYR